MLRPGLSVLLGLCVASLLPGTAGARSCPAGSAARPPVRAQDGQRRPDSGSAGLCSVRLRCCPVLALALLLAALCLGRSLRGKARRRRREEKGWTRSARPRSSPLHDEAIGQDKESSASIKSFLRHLRQRCLRGDVLQRGGNKNVCGHLDEEAAMFSDGENVC